MKALVEWRAALAARGTLRGEDLDELESHVLDRVDALVEEEGVDRADAVERAIIELGEAHAIADEFAKVNPLLAWRAALFWICAGVLMVLGLRPLQVLAAHGVVSASLGLALPKSLTVVLVWAVGLVSPLAFFAVAFSFRQRLVASIATSRRRLLVVVGAAVTMLAEHLGSSWGWFFWLERRSFERVELHDAWTTFMHATYVLAVVAPIALAAFAVHQRARNAASFWLAIGFFVGTVRCEMHELVRMLTLVGAGVGHLDATQTRALVWIVTFAAPCLLAAGTYTFLRHCAPTPSGLVRGRGILVSLVLGTAAAIGAVFATGDVGDHATRILAVDAQAAAIDAWLVSSIVVSAALPILVGALTFRLRDSASRAT
jgi:hypothetical protein